MKPFYNLLITLGLILASIFWGSTFFIIKDILGFVNPVSLVGYRFMLAALILGPILLIKKRHPSKAVFNSCKPGFILGFLLVLLYLPQSIGLLYTSASNSGFITGLFIVFVPLCMLVFYKKPVGFFSWIAIAMSLVGLWFLTGGLCQMNLGDAVTLISALASAGHILTVDKYIKNKKISPYFLSFWQFFFAGLISFSLNWFCGLSFGVASPKIWWAIIYLAVFPSLFAFVMQLVGQRFIAPVKVTLIFALEPVFGAIFAWTLGNEPVVLNQAIGGLLIFAAIILGELEPSKLISKKSAR